MNCFHYIEIGKGCSISDNVCIADSDSHCIDGNKEKATAPIIIEDHVWIGNTVIITKGTGIGPHSVVATGAVVTGKTFPANSAIGGNPAKIVKEGVSWNTEKI